MEFKKMPLRSVLPFISLGFLLIILLLWKFSTGGVEQALEDREEKSSEQNPIVPPPVMAQPMLGVSNEEYIEIQQQLDQDRQQQKQTKDLKRKLEQINLELEEEKSFAELNKLKEENQGTVNEPAIDGQKNLPEVKVNYIGGDSAKKEAILSIGSTNYQVKEKSSPTDNIQVLAISDSGVTLHFNQPQNVTKTIEYKPE